MRPVYIIQNIYSSVLRVFYAFRQEVRVEITPMTYFWEVPGSNHSRHTGHPNRPYFFFNSLQANVQSVSHNTIASFISLSVCQFACTVPTLTVSWSIWQRKQQARRQKILSGMVESSFLLIAPRMEFWFINILRSFNCATFDRGHPIV